MFTLRVQVIIDGLMYKYLSLYLKYTWMYCNVLLKRLNVPHTWYSQSWHAIQNLYASFRILTIVHEQVQLTVLISSIQKYRWIYPVLHLQYNYHVHCRIKVLSPRPKLCQSTNVSLMMPLFVNVELNIHSRIYPYSKHQCDRDTAFIVHSIFQSHFFHSSSCYPCHWPWHSHCCQDQEDQRIWGRCTCTHSEQHW